MDSPSAVPRFPLGEYAYQGLWWGAVLLPALVVLIRVVSAPSDVMFYLLAVIALPALIAGQILAGLLAWEFRRRQWRHWLGPVAAKLSLAYYGAWAVLALALPESAPGSAASPSLAMRPFGPEFATRLSNLLCWLIPALYLALLAAIAVEGRRAVHTWRVKLGRRA